MLNISKPIRLIEVEESRFSGEVWITPNGSDWAMNRGVKNNQKKTGFFRCTKEIYQGNNWEQVQIDRLWDSQGFPLATRVSDIIY